VSTYTTSSAFLDALTQAGVSYIFANWGSDHPALIEAIAAARAEGRKIPEIITCPNEMVALSAAQGYAQATGRPQAVIVHVECGTQALAGAVHNADKGRVPILIFAGSSPFTQEGEMDGSRNEFIQWIQDVHDQRGIVRGYMRYDNEIRTGKNVRQLVERALQFACSDPKGPVYLVGAREVMEEAVEPTSTVPLASPIASPALPENAVAEILADLTGAKRPLVVTSYLGRNPEAVEELVSFCDRHGIAVLESVPNYTNFPTTNPLYQGNHWNHPFQNPVLAEADCILVIDSDVPWIPTVSRPPTGAIIHHIDVDPLKQQMPLWHFPAKGSYRADAMTALRQLNAASGNWPTDPEVLAERRNHYGRLHEERNAKLAALEADRNTLTGEVLTAAIRRHIGEDALYVSEGISHYHTIIDHLALSRPGHLFSSGGGSLGYHGGAAIGVKLANPDKLVVALTGDGSYMFSVPSSVHWIAKRYQTPFLTVVYNNRGWKSPRLSALAVHPDGYAAHAEDIDVSFEPPADYGGIAAAAGNALAIKVTEAGQLDDAIRTALRTIRSDKRSVVLDVWLPHLAAKADQPNVLQSNTTKAAGAPALEETKMDLSLLIAGEDVPAANGTTYDRNDPFTGQLATRAAAAGTADATKAVEAAAAAFPAWSKTGPGERRALLSKAADIMAAKTDDFIKLMIEETGATAPWAGFNVMLASNMLREAAAMTTQITGKIIPSDKPGTLSMAVRQPAGVCLGMAPWNAPVILGTRAIAMALACGNTVVLKASEACPGTHRLIGQVLNEAGLPKGVVNVITNDPKDAPAIVETLIAHPAVKRVNFTGSTRVGRIIAELAGRHLKPVLLELGGKAPLVVLDDADVDAAVNAAVFGAFMNQGQICMSTERIIVDNAIADAFVTKLAERAAHLPAGDPRGHVVLGSLIDERAAQRMEKFIADATAKGGGIVAGGKRNGSVVEATVIDNVRAGMRIYDEESFGPVKPIIRVAGEDEAVRIANDTGYGLSSAVFSQNVQRAMNVASRLETGICHINGPTVHDEAQMPFGGVKGSGYGRFGGEAAIDEFTDLRWITIEDPKQHYPF
jgi:acyl-CoA reductase-like NAD-dependent aldehyde dehydrogenase/thiamine pyrophosphate-dependent acetolactate synthase large subunit-like protein